MKYIFFIVIILLSSFISKCQSFEIEDEDISQKPMSGVLGSAEIQIINNSGKNVFIQCSIDKKSWVKKVINNTKSIDINLTSDIGFFYVQVCGSSGNDTECDIYKLKPSIRYILATLSNNKIIIKKL
jgi:hypothetical protein